MTDTTTVGMSLSFGDMLRRDRQNRAPDVLNTIANLSSDEVFTPPEFANRMLDTLAEAWAADHEGASIWADPDVTFLDPATKSGVFLREITKRLVEGQGGPPEGSDERKALVDRVLTKQVFGIGMTTLTALLARRSIYCSKDTTSKHSVAPSFTDPDGNIWFGRTEHDWAERKRERRVDPLRAGEVVVEVEGTGKCRWCPATESAYARGNDLETHAYALIHTDDPKGLVADLFGDGMQFDVVVGNPPYQLREENSGEGQSASPIYQKFVAAAQALDPRYLVMVTPTRWIAGGKGLDEYRTKMLSDHRLRSLTDFADPSEVFPGVNIRGGVSYFLWDRSYDGQCRVTTVKGGETVTADRSLDEFDVFVRDQRAAEILRKVRAKGDQSFGLLVSARNPFGLSTNFYDVHEKVRRGDLTIQYIKGRKRAVGFMDPTGVAKNRAAIKSWKVFVAKAGTDGSATPDSVLTKPIIGEPDAICTDSFLYVSAESGAAARSIVAFYSTRFFRFLVSLRKITQDASRDTYSWVPVQPWDRAWTDDDLYAKYGLTEAEAAYIASVIRPMDLDTPTPDEE